MAPSVRAALGGSNSSRACGMGCVAAACVRPTINAFRAVGERGVGRRLRQSTRWCCLFARPRRRMSRLVAVGQWQTSAWHRGWSFRRRCDRGLSPAQNPQDSSREPAAIPTLDWRRAGGPQIQQHWCAGVISHLLVAPLKQSKSQVGRRCGGRRLIYNFPGAHS